ncbi:MAG: Twitching mobility protein, partial [Acidobacteria bacterium]|nr:Twitching mobility protein [Acidobacteriota bacterium]
MTVQPTTPPPAAESLAFSLNDLLVYMAQQKASDLHLKPMRPPLVRVQGKLVAIKSEPLNPADLEKLLLPLLYRAQREKFDHQQSV